jgi:hypothetical protein
VEAKEMKGYWKILLPKITIWIIAEIILNFAGLDRIADYGEFVLKPHLDSEAWGASIALTFPSKPHKS